MQIVSLLSRPADYSSQTMFLVHSGTRGKAELAFVFKGLTLAFECAAIC